MEWLSLEQELDWWISTWQELEQVLRPNQKTKRWLLYPTVFDRPWLLLNGLGTLQDVLFFFCPFAKKIDSQLWSSSLMVACYSGAGICLWTLVLPKTGFRLVPCTNDPSPSIDVSIQSWTNGLWVRSEGEDSQYIWPACKGTPDNRKNRDRIRCEA